MSSYDALAASYDGLMADGVYRRRADYLEKLFQKSRIPVHTVLDLACGTGTIACLLAAKGYAVTATDLSEEMLTQAIRTRPRKATASGGRFSRKRQISAPIRWICSACGQTVHGTGTTRSTGSGRGARRN